MIQLEVSAEWHGALLRDFLRAQGCSATFLSTAKKYRGFFINGMPMKANERVYAGALVTIPLVPEQNSVPPEDLPLRILYEDAYSMVLEKPAGMAMHPSMTVHSGTLANAFAGEMCRRGISRAFRALNRLDRGVSGLVLCAMNAYAAPILARSVKKTYYALTEGCPQPLYGVWDMPIARREDSAIVRCCDARGKPSKTVYRVLTANYRPGLALLACTLYTGRTHQIRVHAAFAGCPLAGDELYGAQTNLQHTPALCCGKLSFPAVQTQRQIAIELKLPFSHYTGIDKYEDCAIINKMQ